MAEKRLLYRVPEACDQLRVSRATMNKWLASGELPSIKLGASRRIEAVELERFVARRREESDSNSHTTNE